MLALELGITYRSLKLSCGAEGHRCRGAVWSGVVADAPCRERCIYGRGRR
jgi:hypothetical protein